MPNLLCKVQAIYSFKSEDPESLGFQKGDYIDVFYKLSSGWWNGRCNDDKGWFPSNFVRVIKENSVPEFDDLTSDIPNTYHFQTHNDESLVKECLIIESDTNSFLLKNELTYKSLLSESVSVINTLTTATRVSEYNTYAKDVIYIIRVIMMSTGTIHKAPNDALKDPRQSVITLLSKLVISAYSNSIAKLFIVSQDLLWAIRSFLKLCETSGVDLISIDPVFILPSDWEFNKKTAVQTLMSNLTMDIKSRGQSVQNYIKVFTASLDHCSTEPRDSLETILLDHYRCFVDQNDLLLSAVESVDFKHVAHSPFMHDLKLAKQKLYAGLCLLFIAVQLILDQTMSTDTVLAKIKHALASISEDVQPICKAIAELVIEQKKHQERIPQDAQTCTELGTLGALPQVPSKLKIATQPPPAMNLKKELPLTPCYSERELGTCFSSPLKSPLSVESPRTTDWFMQYDYAANDIAFTAEGQVISGNLSALVERVTLHDQLDTNYNSTFVLTYRSFCTPNELVELLDARYHIQPPPGLTVEEFDIWKRKKQRPVQLRVCNMVKILLDQDYDERDSCILDRLMVFAERSLSYHFEFFSGRIKASIMKRKDSARLKRWVSTQPIHAPEPILPRHLLTLTDIESIEMARQLTLIDSKLFRSIRPTEWLDTHRLHQSTFLRFSRQLSRWVAHEIAMHPPGSKKRRATFKYWISIAKKCRQLNNLNTCMTILSTLDPAGKVRWQNKSHLVHYRNLIQSIQLPCIPFMTIFLEDLASIAEREPNFLENGHVHFIKRSKLADVVRQIQHFQSTSYALKSAEEIQEFIWKNLNRSNDHYPLKLEPKEEMNDKLARLLQELGFT